MQAVTVEAQSNPIFAAINGRANASGKINRLKIPSPTDGVDGPSGIDVPHCGSSEPATRSRPR